MGSFMTAEFCSRELRALEPVLNRTGLVDHSRKSLSLQMVTNFKEISCLKYADRFGWGTEFLKRCIPKKMGKCVSGHFPPGGLGASTNAKPDFGRHHIFIKLAATEP